ncbi:MAG: aspartate 1-decarboxylase [Francisella endosymbiont of Hyalomma asiaticum]
MLISVLKSKISYATMSGKDLFYVGSITIDSEIMKQANIIENEKVQVINLNNGERLEIYVIKGQVNSKTIVLNGTTARKCEIGDQIFIITYAQIDPTKESIKPKLVDLKTGE